MNPGFHDEFLSLCALFYSGELSDEEWALLQVHLAYCESCRETFEQFKVVNESIFPAMAASAAEEAEAQPEESQTAFREAEARLMSKVGQKRTAHSEDSQKKTAVLAWAAVLAACVLVTVAFAYSQLTRRRLAAVQTAHLESTKTKPLVNAAADATPVPPSRNVQEDTTKLQARIADLEAKAATSNAFIASLQNQLQLEQQERDQLIAEKSDLTGKLAITQTGLQTMSERAASAESSQVKQNAAAAGLEAKVRELNAELEDTNDALADKERMLALDKDFMSHDREIRDLIGARDLYIADIFDMTETGKTAKPFGRIFYTRDRSLVFYGFDLEKQQGMKQAAAFQAWGSGTDHQPVSLGLFYQDESHNRWVLRFNDPKTLARLNMVFVTVEPAGGSHQPTGKPLLRAYLQIQANHP